MYDLGQGKLTTCKRRISHLHPWMSKNLINAQTDISNYLKPIVDQINAAFVARNTGLLKIKPAADKDHLIPVAQQRGAVILPAAPGWYHGVRGVGDLVDFIVARILDQLGVPHQLVERWGAGDSQSPQSPPQVSARDTDD